VWLFVAYKGDVQQKKQGFFNSERNGRPESKEFLYKEFLHVEGKHTALSALSGTKKMRVIAARSVIFTT
jgi:hypothetical protein